MVDSLLIKKSMLFTLSSNGKAARMWYAPAGDLMWDAFLYSDVDEEEAPVAGLSANNDATWVTVGGVAHVCRLHAQGVTEAPELTRVAVLSDCNHVTRQPHPAASRLWGGSVAL